MLQRTLCRLKSEKGLQRLLGYLGVSKGFLYNLIDGNQRVRPSKLAYVYRKLGVRKDEFFFKNQKLWVKEKPRSPLGSLVYNKRKQMTMSLSDLARQMKIGYRTLHRIENYQKWKFNPSTVKEVMDYLSFSRTERAAVMKWHCKYTSKIDQYTDIYYIDGNGKKESFKGKGEINNHIDMNRQRSEESAGNVQQEDTST